MKHLYRHLTWPEAREHAATGAVVIIPVAAIEQRGFHLPIDVDNLLVEHVPEEAAMRSQGAVIVAPMIHYGFNEHNIGFPETISIRDTVFTDFCYDAAHSLVRQGYDRLVFVNGHGSNQMLCNLAARRINNPTSALCASVAHWVLAKDAGAKPRDSAFPGGMAHACEFKTVIYLHLKPELAEMEKPVRGRPPPSWDTSFMTTCSVLARCTWSIVGAELPRRGLRVIPGWPRPKRGRTSPNARSRTCSPSAGSSAPM